MSIFDVISFAGGLALFLYGMRIMGNGLQQGSSGALKNAMKKVTANPFMGFMLGLVITAVVQSSTATIVITSGLVGAGIITLPQSLGVILGANVGTTITGQIIRLLDLNAGAASWLNLFKPVTLAPLAAVIGILLIMVFRFKNADTWGGIAMGFGILFTGLLNMTATVAPLAESQAFANLLIGLSETPILGFIAGLAACFCIQSSSATVGILQALAITGKLTFGSIYAMLLGIFMGDCITTAIVCSIGAKADAKRTGMIHIIFNVFQVLLLIVVVTVLHKVGVFGSFWDAPINSGGIANANTVFKLFGAITLLPFVKLFEKLSRMIIKDDVKKGQKEDAELAALDEKFFTMPALALSSSHRSINMMADLAVQGALQGMSILDEYSADTVAEINEKEDKIDKLADMTNSYLARLSAHAKTDDDITLLNYYLQCLPEFERIGDHAVNLTECATELVEKGSGFSPIAKQEMALLSGAIGQIMEYAGTAFKNRDEQTALSIEPLEEVVDAMVEKLRNRHTRRLIEGKCSVYGGLVFLNVLTNVERIADQCSNIGISTIGLSNPEIAKTHHEYLYWLHSGQDKVFNEKYQMFKEQYLAELDKLQG
ncbi:MAG: Na/Pi cotransporter family protein [Clostridia bacterium]|nr:Na/Pi cotransporter family protein [Clostridia bacterium]